MSDDWQPGDLALCISNGPRPDHWLSGSGGPRVGSAYVVQETDDSDGSDGFEAGIWLKFAEWEDGYFSRGFRKIRPHTADEEDRETIRLLTGAPVKEPTEAERIKGAA